MGVAEAMIASTVISAGAGMSQASKAAKAAGKAPPKRYYLGEMQDALEAQASIQPRLLELERQFTPQYQALQRDTLMGQMGMLESLYGEAAPISQRLGQMNMDAMSPQYQRAGTEMMNAYNTMLGPQAFGIMSELNRQASSELQLGGQLSAEEQMRAQQAARAAAGARGMQFGNQAVASEVLADYGLSQSRQAQRRQFAGDVYGMNAQNAVNAYNMYGQPLMSQVAATSPAMMLASSAEMSAGLGPRIFNPESQYMADVQGGNVQNQMSAQLASAQARAGMGAGLISMAGSLGGAALGAYGMMNAPASTVTNTYNLGGGGGWRGIPYR